MDGWQQFKSTLELRMFGLLKIPMVFSMKPSIVEADEKHVVIKVPLIRRNRNHVNSMYVGVLAGAADMAAGFLAINAIKRSGEPIIFLVKDLHVDFLKKADGDVLFTCEQGQEIATLVQEAIISGKRVDLPVKVVATVPSKHKDPVANFVVTISLRKR